MPAGCMDRVSNVIVEKIYPIDMSIRQADWTGAILGSAGRATRFIRSHTMSESFADLFEESLKTIEMHPGAIITASSLT